MRVFSFFAQSRSMTTQVLYHHPDTKHPFHLVDPSPWPLLTAVGAFCTTRGGVAYMHGYLKGSYILSGGLLRLLAAVSCWWRDVIREATFEGHHTLAVQAGLKQGMLLFIVSEVVFFFGFFWAFFHSSLAPTAEIGGVWPPLGIDVLSPWEVPLLNTLILLLSGASATWSHHARIIGARQQARLSLFLTIFLALVFTGLQAFEYVNASFSINDSVYGSCFYLATGFHGAHVLLGTIFLAVCAFRMSRGHLTREHHAGFEFSLRYWHFVDVVWLFRFVTVYWWGG